MGKKCLGLFALAVLMLSTIGIPAHAAEENNADSKGIVIMSYDPVAYFTAGKPTKGSAAYRAKHEGGIYQFASAENRDRFTAMPDKYAPAYGGWCSYGVRVGKKFRIDPQAWEITDGRLFLQLDLGTKKVWMSEKAKNIEIADRLWPKIKPLSTKALGN